MSLLIPRDDTGTASPSWAMPKNQAWFEKTGVTIRCRNGHVSSMVWRIHTVGEDGTVMPSFVCRYDRCDFHEWIRLDEWPEGVRK